MRPSQEALATLAELAERYGGRPINICLVKRPKTYPADTWEFPSDLVAKQWEAEARASVAVWSSGQVGGFDYVSFHHEAML